MKTHISQVDQRVLWEADNDDVLTAAEVVSSTALPVSGYTHISGFVFADVDSATNGLVIEQAMDIDDFAAANTASSSKVTVSKMTITGNDIENNAISVQIVGRFARIVYTNGGSDQATFRAFFTARAVRGL